MIFLALSQSSRYAMLHPLFRQAFDYIRDIDLHALTPGRHDIAGDDLFVIVEQAPGKTREMAKLEAHRKYIDIQLALEGNEQMGWKPLADCHKPVSDYSAEKDIQFFHDAPASWIAVPPGHFCIFFPEDAHAPLVSAGSRCDTLLPAGRRPVGAPLLRSDPSALAQPADCGSNGQAANVAHGIPPNQQGSLIHKVIFKIAVAG
jgi:biofilm protein TabA